MNKVENEIKKIIEKSSGRMIGIGLSKDMIKMIEKNKEITTCDLLNSYTKSSKEKGKEKRFDIKKLRKKYKKNKIDFIIADFNELNKYYKTFIKDSIYVCKGRIYFFNENELLEKYKRYNAKIEKTNIVTIDVANAKTNYVKDKIYYLIDLIDELINYISDFLTM